MKKQLTIKEYLMLSGLLYLGCKFAKKVTEVDKAIADLFGEEEQYGMWSDFIWSDDNDDVDDLLKRMNVVVEKEAGDD